MTLPNPLPDTDIPKYLTFLKTHDAVLWAQLGSRFNRAEKEVGVGLMEKGEFDRIKVQIKYALCEALKDVPDPEQSPDQTLAALIRLEAIASVCFDPENPKVPDLWRTAIIDARTAIQHTQMQRHDSRRSVEIFRNNTRYRKTESHTERLKIGWGNNDL